MSHCILYPGQGSQSPGMGRFLFEEFKRARETFEEASDAINLDLKKLCFEDSLESLSLTENTQPALLTVSTATTRVLVEQFGDRGLCAQYFFYLSPFVDFESDIIGKTGALSLF